MECQVKSLLRAKNNPYSFGGKGVSIFDEFLAMVLDKTLNYFGK
jgi:hypothetical protein